MNEVYCGLDLGQASDYTALALAERCLPPTDRDNAQYHFGHVERLKLGTAYPDVVTHVTTVVERARLKGAVTLVLDYTGVGRPVADMFRKARLSCQLRAIYVHSGDAVTWDGWMIGVPKRDLIAAAQVLLQTKRLQIAGAMPDTTALTTELQNYRVKIDPQTAHDSYAAWREGVHDDLVFAVALACWMGENQRRAFAVR
jgi:hypothetical protein